MRTWIKQNKPPKSLWIKVWLCFSTSKTVVLKHYCEQWIFGSLPSKIQWANTLRALRSILENLLKLHDMCIMFLWEWIDRKKSCHSWVRRHNLGIKGRTFYDTTNIRVLNCLGFVHPSLEDGVCCLEVQAAQKAVVEGNRPLSKMVCLTMPHHGEGQCT